MHEKQNISTGAIVFAVAVLAGLLVYGLGTRDLSRRTPVSGASLEDQVLPPQGVELPVTWGDLGKQLVEKGVIDQQKFEAIYAQRGGLAPEDRRLLSADGNGRIVLTAQNSGKWLNLLWALGLANKNAILEQGEMMDPKYGGAGVFASTGGWSLARGEAMDHYSMHSLAPLTPAQQDLVDRVSRNVYRPCCGNSTHFPDCNHGMAMLGLLELAASQGADEAALYRIALAANSYWFPDTYLNLARYMEEKGVAWADVNPAQILGADFSSGAGYQNILSQIVKPEQPQGGSCGV